jgi:hypothetical protein
VTHKKRKLKKFHVLKCRASFDNLYGGLGISKLQFYKKSVSAVNFLTFGHQIPGSGTGSALTKNAGCRMQGVSQEGYVTVIC